MGENKADNSGSDAKKKTTNLNEMILGSLKSRSGRETTRWINDLTQEGLADAVVSHATEQPSAVTSSSLISWVDKLFDLFQQYEVEFNKAVSSAELKMEVERPVIGQDFVSRMQSNDHLHYSGRLHAHNMSLLIRGNLQAIEGYILPSDHLIAFTGNESAYTRYFQALPVWERSELKLDLNGVKIAYGDLPPLAKQLFGGLVLVVKGGASERDPFVFGGKSQSGNAQEEPAHGHIFESPVEAAPPSVQNIPSQNLLPQKTQVLPVNPAPAPAVKELPPKQVIAARTGETGLVASPSGIDMNQACDILLQTLDRELEHLSGTGAKAFERRDLATVEMALKKSAKLKELHDQIHTTVNEWKRLLAEI